ncbi:coilin [Aulostomus maculatus]
MAAPSNSCIRVRLNFDYPPPAVVDCRMCWLLVDLNTCRVVADLESIIREKFEFSRRSIVSLFIEDCYLPHTESIYVVRDNDSVRVKVDALTQTNGHSSHADPPRERHRKRRCPSQDDGPVVEGVDGEWKKRKRKKTSEESLEGETKQTSGDERQKTLKLKTSEKKKKKRKTKVEKNGVTAAPKPPSASRKVPASIQPPVQSLMTKMPARKPQDGSSSSSSSSSSGEEDAPPKTCSSPPAVTKSPPKMKPTQKQVRPPSSSSDSSSSSDEDTAVKTTSNSKPLTPAPPRLSLQSKSQQSNGARKEASVVLAPPADKPVEEPEPPPQNDEEEIELVIRRPLQLQQQAGGPDHSRGPARLGGGGPGRRGRGEGRGGFRGHSRHVGSQEASHQTDSLTNTSVVLQNRAGSPPKPDYSSMPLLAAPPQVGQKIAFKLLELTENYTPEVSEYKEGKIVTFDPITSQIELELLSASQAPVEPGKFDLVYQNPDGSERVEYAVSRGSWVTERWDSLLEPRLII